MSQSRFSIVLVGVSALLRRPLVSRLRPADGERSPWVVFTARVGRFDSGFGRSAGWPSGSPLPLFGTHRFGDCRRASSFFHLPLRSCRSAGWSSGSQLPLFGTHRFGDCPRRVGSSAQRVGLRAHCFRLSARTASEIAAGRVGSSAFCFGDCRWAGWPSGSPLPLFCTHRFGVAAGRVRSSAFRFRNCPRRIGLRVHRFRFLARTASEIAAGRVGLRTHRFGVAVRRIGLRAHGFHFSARADPHRRTAEARTDGAQRHDTCFTSKHLSQHVNLPHRTP